MKISEKCLRALPPGKFVKFSREYDMDNNLREVVVWSFIQAGYARVAYFDTETGEYVGDAL